MHLELLKTVLVRDITDLEEIVSGLEEGYVLSKIEIQLIKSRIKNLSQEISELVEKLDSEDQPREISIKEEKKIATAEHQITEEKCTKKTKERTEQIKPEATTPSAKVEKNIEEPAPQKSPIKEKEITEVVEIVKPTEPIKAKEKKEKETPVTDRKTVADKFVDAGISVNEKVGHVIDRASMLGRKPVADIHKAIKINDKIGFLKELFNGESETYMHTIDTLNNFSDIEEALGYIRQNFDWDQESEQFKSFIEIVYRRYL